MFCGAEIDFCWTDCDSAFLQGRRPKHEANAVLEKTFGFPVFRGQGPKSVFGYHAVMESNVVGLSGFPPGLGASPPSDDHHQKRSQEGVFATAGDCLRCAMINGITAPYGQWDCRFSLDFYVK